MAELRSEDLAFVERAPLVIEATRTIPAPPAAVWPGIGDAEAWPEWFPNLSVARYTTPEPYGVGTGRHVEVRGLVVEEVLLAMDEPTHYAFCVVESNLPGIEAMVEDVHLDAVGDGTRVTYVQALDLKMMLRPATRVLRWQLRRALEDGLAGLERWVAAGTA